MVDLILWNQGHGLPWRAKPARGQVLGTLIFEEQGDNIKSFPGKGNSSGEDQNGPRAEKEPEVEICLLFFAAPFGGSLRSAADRVGDGLFIPETAPYCRPPGHE